MPPWVPGSMPVSSQVSPPQIPQASPPRQTVCSCNYVAAIDQFQTNDARLEKGVDSEIGISTFSFTMVEAFT